MRQCAGHVEGVCFLHRIQKRYILMRYYSWSRGGLPGLCLAVYFDCYIVWYLRQRHATVAWQHLSFGDVQAVAKLPTSMFLLLWRL